MSSGQPEIIFQEIRDSTYENILEREIDISQLVIPFSKVFKSFKPRDIYIGNENMPFKEREPEFKRILRQEFSKQY
ncbi:hypothetical protein LCGC14_1034530 [marine sediment metagenome]|uniref:Uncharacterized protein n=1 Tax=marine sediment metagenome TaxID=412755 RepID=A0A0F9MTL4_9ZZZZ